MYHHLAVKLLQHMLGPWSLRGVDEARRAVARGQWVAIAAAINAVTATLLVRSRVWRAGLRFGNWNAGLPIQLLRPWHVRRVWRPPLRAWLARAYGGAVAAVECVSCSRVAVAPLL